MRKAIDINKKLSSSEFEYQCLLLFELTKLHKVTY
jgi:hypothetical protein